MGLSDRHRRFLLVEQGLGPAVFNCAINGAIVWALFRSAVDVPIWGAQSVGVDLLATAFILPLLTCVIVSALVGRQVRSGKVPPLASGQLPHSSWFKRSVLKRALLLATAGVLFGAAPIVWALSLGQAQAFTVPAFVVFKALWSAMLASVVTPIAGWWALANVSR
jgi:hypothetical protein